MKVKDIKIDYIKINENIILIGWSANIGFGVLTIHHINNNFEVETEGLGEEFYKDILQKVQEYLLINSKIIE